VKLSSIGDVVHTLPAVAALRRAHPHARISWIVDVRASAILKGSPAIDQLIEIDSRRWRKALFDARTLDEVRQCLSHLRGGRTRPASDNAQDAASNGWPDRRPDKAIDFQGLVKSGLIALLSGANRRVGFASPDLREKASRYLLTDQMSGSRAVHVIEKNLELAECIPPSAAEPLLGHAGANGGRKYDFPIAVSPEDQTFIEDFVSQTARSPIINPGGGWVTKLWPPARYSELVDWLWGEHGIESFVTYGPGEARLAREVVSASRSGRCREISLTLKQFVALARRATLFVGGDT